MKSKQKHFDKYFNVSVIGYNGSQQQGVGKSCLINRFINPQDYHEKHQSVVNSIDFQQEILGGSHWLYWGENPKYNVRVFEQTVFVDDHLFEPLPSDHLYIDRCLETTLKTINRKYQYKSRSQFGGELDPRMKFLEPGRYLIHAFVFVLDVTAKDTCFEQQLRMLQVVLDRLAYQNRPVVIALCKCEISDSVIFNQLSGIYNRMPKNFRKRQVCTVENSARLNLNVTTVFDYAVRLYHDDKSVRGKYFPIPVALQRTVPVPPVFSADRSIALSGAAVS